MCLKIQKYLCFFNVKFQGGCILKSYIRLPLYVYLWGQHFSKFVHTAFPLNSANKYVNAI